MTDQTLITVARVLSRRAFVSMVAVLAAAILFCAYAGAQELPLRKTFFGVPPLLIDTHNIQIESGVLADADELGYMEFPAVPKADRTIFIGRIGAWGLDRSLEEGGTGWWHLWAIQRSSDGYAAMMLSACETSSCGVALPSGFDRVRKLPGAWYINGSSAGIRKQVLASWPHPAEFVYQDHSTAHEATFETGGAWQPVSLIAMVPSNARFAYLIIQAERVSSEGYAWVRTPGSGDGGPGVHTNGSSGQTSRKVALSSGSAGNEIQVRTSAGVRARVRVVGFSILETY